MKVYSYDDITVDKLVDANKARAKTCQACGKLFIPGPERNSTRRKYCYRTHYCICENCGKEFIVERDLAYPNKTCSKKCNTEQQHANLVKTMQEKYGVDNPSQHPELHAKAVKSILAKQDQITAHLMQTMQEKYGGMGTASPVLRAKIDKTIQEKYGVDNVSRLPGIREKIRTALKSDESVAKYKATSRSHYGTDYPAQSEEIQYLMKKTCMERYGVEYVGSLPEVIAKTRDTVLKRYGYTTYLSTDAAREKARAAVLANFSGRISKLNKEFGEKLSANNINYEFEYYLNRKWYDMRLTDCNTVVEIDPSYTHSSVPSHWSEEGLDPNYHVMKTEKAKEAGYRCIHIFDWDDWDKMMTVLKQPVHKIGARKCELRLVTNKESNAFLDEHHIQGAVQGVLEGYGLYYQDKLIQVMTFGRPRYTKKYDFELLRLCTLPDYAVSGGAERLFKHFTMFHLSSTILSYCDLAKFSGEVYSRLGFQLDHVSSPAKVWSRGKQRVTDNLLRQRGYDQLFGTSYGKGTSNEQLMLDNGWLPVYDCGQAVYVCRI